jgi:hypothetical protein
MSLFVILTLFLFPLKLHCRQSVFIWMLNAKQFVTHRLANFQAKCLFKWDEWLPCSIRTLFKQLSKLCTQFLQDSCVALNIFLTFCFLLFIFLFVHAMSYRGLDPVVLPSAASQAVKTRLITFVRSLSTVLAVAYILTRCTCYILRKTAVVFCKL